MRECQVFILGFVLNYFVFTAYAAVCSSNKFGRNCMFTCHCRNDVSCDEITGRCPRGCAPGWDGDSCQRENVAYRRETRQKDGKNVLHKSSDLAVDDDPLTCSATKPAVPGWWTVSLTNTTIINTVKLVTDNQSDINGWKVYAGTDDKIFSMTLCTTIRFHGDGALLECDMPIVTKHVMVVNRVGPVTLCDVGIFACSRFWFGTECDKACNCADPQEVCDVDSGACSSGCDSGWTGHDCQTGCRNRYGIDCKYPCGKCENNITCNKTNGACPTGCQEGWRGVYCTDVCEPETFGKNCNRKCLNCHGDGSCDGVTGKCNYGCNAGFMGDHCNKECEKGTFGENCNFKCHNCADGMACDTKTGVCLNGCQPGWEGAFCTQDCMSGYYGRNCEEICDNCLDRNCDRINGQCLAGCAAGFIGANCTEVCESGNYGMNCSETCGYCKEGEGHMCDVTNGTCAHGCELAYDMPLCKELCPPGRFGEGCQKCGMCRPTTTCDIYTGQCPDGCALMFDGDMCMKAEPFSDEDGPQLAIFLGFMITLVGLMMSVVTVCLVLVWQREELADISRKPGQKLAEHHEISVREENGLLMRSRDRDHDEEDSV